MPAVHHLKTWPAHFNAIDRGDKNFEVRKDDRAFQAGDTLVLEYFDPMAIDQFGTPMTLQRRITFVLPGGQFGIEHGYCVLGLADDGRIPAGTP